jgi:hypothetical protein
MSKKQDTKNIEDKLKELIGSAGELTIYYGGYEIIVSDNDNFMWGELFNYVLQYGFNVYIGLKEGKINVIIKQNW